MSTNAIPDLLTDEQVAELLGCEISTVQARLVGRELPGLKFGRNWRIPRDALLAHLNKLANQHLVKPEAKPQAVKQEAKGQRQPPKLVGL